MPRRTRSWNTLASTTAPWCSWRPAGMAEYRGALDAVQRLAAEVRQPAARCMAAVVQASLALLEGRFADAEALVESALRSGGSSVPWDAVIFSRVQRFALRLEDGRLAEL